MNSISHIFSFSNPIFVKFDLNPAITQNRDEYEKLADQYLFPLRSFMGTKTVNVLKEWPDGRLLIGSSGYLSPSKKSSRFYDILKTICRIALFIFFLPMTFLGCLALRKSSSHKEMMNKFLLTKNTRYKFPHRAPFRYKGLDPEPIQHTSEGFKILKNQLDLAVPLQRDLQQIHPSGGVELIRLKLHKRRLNGLNLASQKLPDGQKIKVLHKIGRFAEGHLVKYVENKETYLKNQLLAREHNKNLQILDLPRDILVKELVPHLSNAKDLMSLGLVCNVFAAAIRESCKINTSLAAQEIDRLTKTAEFFNKQLLMLTQGTHSLIKNEEPAAQFPNYQFFQFDLKKWKDTMKRISEPKSVFSAIQLAGECRLDLIEALAEYNIPSNLILGVGGDTTRFLKNFSVFSSTFEEKILDAAKLALKGDLWAPNEVKSVCEMTKPYTVGPFASTVFSPQHGQLGHLPYRSATTVKIRILSGEYIHFKYLIGKRTGDRVVLKRKSFPVILRCRKHPNSSKTFEQSLMWVIRRSLDAYLAYRDYNRILDGYHQAFLDPQVYANFQSMEREMIKAYGQEEIEKVR